MSYPGLSYLNHIRSKKVVKVVIIFITWQNLVFEKKNGVFHSKKNVYAYFNDRLRFSLFLAINSEVLKRARRVQSDKRHYLSNHSNTNWSWVHYVPIRNETKMMTINTTFLDWIWFRYDKPVYDITTSPNGILFLVFQRLLKYFKMIDEFFSLTKFFLINKHGLNIVKMA